MELRAAGFEALYRAEYAPLVRLAYALTGSLAEAEELVQESFLRCHRNWARVSTYDKPGARLRRVVVNLATSRGRRLVSEAKAFGRLRSRAAVAGRVDLDGSAEAF
ncbi:MAG TPA: sigma factor [Acidimicrobiales bacterium]